MEDFEMSQEEIENRYTLTIFLCAIFGVLGIHRFVNGKTVSGIAMLLTCGGCGIWAVIDFIVIVSGEFKNSNGVLIATEIKNNLASIFATISIVLSSIGVITTLISM